MRKSRRKEHQKLHPPRVVPAHQQFKRARIMQAQINEAHILPIAQRQIALGLIGHYRARGKGRGAPSKRFGNKPGAYMPHQGKQECARRVRQAEARRAGFTLYA